MAIRRGNKSLASLASLVSRNSASLLKPPPAGRPKRFTIQDEIDASDRDPFNLGTNDSIVGRPWDYDFRLANIVKEEDTDRDSKFHSVWTDPGAQYRFNRTAARKFAMSSWDWSGRINNVRENPQKSGMIMYIAVASGLLVVTLTQFWNFFEWAQREELYPLQPHRLKKRLAEMEEKYGDTLMAPTLETKNSEEWIREFHEKTHHHTLPPVLRPHHDKHHEDWDLFFYLDSDFGKER